MSVLWGNDALGFSQQRLKVPGRADANVEKHKETDLRTSINGANASGGRLVMAYVVMAYVVMACMLMARIAMAHVINGSNTSGRAGTLSSKTTAVLVIWPIYLWPI